ncbi:hypothetical protein ACAG39_02495 [Caldicellulosiruptoraceae bacterium PP1]
MLKNKLLLYLLNFLLIIFLQSFLQPLVNIKGNSVIFIIPFIISNILLFDYIDSIIVNILSIFIFCSVYTNDFGVYIIIAIVISYAIEQLKKKLYIERIEVSVISVFIVNLLIVSLYSIFYIMLAKGIDIKQLFETFLIRSIIDSVTSVFLFSLFKKESIYLNRIKKGRNLKEE